jgi:hypothetical protein
MAGRAAITVVTKWGTNEFHGSAFGFHSDNHITARDFFAASTPKAIMNIVGGTLGGPIRKNKLFFFASWEGTFQRVGWAGLFTVPTADQRSGDVRAYGTTIYEPATGNINGTGRSPFPGAIVPLNRQSSIARTVQGWIPMPNQKGAVSNYFTSGTTRLSGRIRFSGSNHWARYSDVQRARPEFRCRQPAGCGHHEESLERTISPRLHSVLESHRERTLPASFVVTMGYVGTQTVHQLAGHNINAAGPGGGTAAGRSTQPSPDMLIPTCWTAGSVRATTPSR